MTIDNYVGLHNHTSFSLLDGLQSPDGSLDRAKELGQKALAITDHGDCSGHYKFYQHATKLGINPILGMEGYLADDSLAYRKANKIKENSHITFLAKNNDGLRDLWTISSLAYRHGFYYKPTADWEMLQDILGPNQKDLIATGGCFAGEERFVTSTGSKTFADTVGTTQKVLGKPGKSGAWVDAEIKSFGVQEIVGLTVVRDGRIKTIRTTDNHRWFSKRHPSGSKYSERLTRDLTEGDILQSLAPPVFLGKTTMSAIGIQMGIVFGDGSVDVSPSTGRKSSRVRLYGDKDRQLLKWFPLQPQTECATEDAVEVRGLPSYFKESPDLVESQMGHLLGWLAGYFAADGCVSKQGSATMSSTNRENMQLVRDVCSIIGIRTGAIRTIDRIVPLPRGGTMESCLYQVTLDTRNIPEEFFLIDHHRERILDKNVRKSQRWSDWKVVSVAPTGDYEEVFCAVVPNGHAFTLEDDLFTGNCMLSYLGRAILREDSDRVDELMGRYLKTFGEDNFYLELHTWQIMDPATEEHLQLNSDMTKINQGLLDISKDWGVRTIAVNDSHYSRECDSENHGILWSMNTKTNDDQVGHRPAASWMMSEDEIHTWLGKHGVPTSVIEQSIQNTADIGEECVVSFDTSLKIPNAFGSKEKDKEMFVRKNEEGFQRKVVSTNPDNLDEYIERNKMETEFIQKWDLDSYFLIVSDYRRFALDNGILSGPGRGSSAGSLTCFNLDINEVDPVKYGLYFERFLNPGRMEKGSLPDIDLDFGRKRRQDIINYLKAKYGEDHVAGIATYQRLGTKGALKKLCAAFKVPFADSTALSKLLDVVDGWDSMTSVDWDDIIANYPDGPGKGQLKNYMSQYPKVFEKVPEFLGLIAHAGQHASGFIVSSESLLGAVPLRAKENKETGEMEYVTQFEMASKYGEDLKKLGYVKFDILGVEHLDVLTKAQELSGHGTDPRFFYNLSDDDLGAPEIWKHPNQAKTNGLFQLNTGAFKQLMKRFKATSQKDVAELVAINRPNVIRAGLLDSYLDRRSGKEEVAYSHPMLKDILGRTYGIPIYQEQVMDIFRWCANYSLAESDDIRRIISDKDPVKMDQQKETFVNRCVANPEFSIGSETQNRQAAEDLWEVVKENAEYSFNQCVTGDTNVYLGASGPNSDGTMRIEDMYKRLHYLNAPYTKNEGDCLYCGNSQKAVWRGRCSSCHAWIKKFKSKGLFAQSLDHDGRVRIRRIKDVHFNGTLPCYRVTLLDGRSIESTDNHRHMTSEGWKETKNLTINDHLLVVGNDSDEWQESYDYSLTQGGTRSYAGSKMPNHERTGVNSVGYIDGSFVRLKEWTESQIWTCSVKGCNKSKEAGDRIERAHLDGDRTNNVDANLRMMCASHHKIHDYRLNGRNKRWSRGKPTKAIKIVAIEPVSCKDVYDLEMVVSDGEGDDSVEHSWIADGIVTHNSHSQAYALISAWGAYMKGHYPMEFITACLAVDRNEEVSYVREGKDMGFDIMPPHVNTSLSDFNLADGKIWYGLRSVSKVGEKSANAITRAQPFTSFEDFSSKVSRSEANVGVLENLILLGAFDGIPFKEGGVSDDSLDGRRKFLNAFYAERKIDRVAPVFTKERLQELEKSIVGTYITHDPIAQYSSKMTQINLNVPDMEELESGESATFSGVITKMHEHMSKNGMMVFLDVEWEEKAWSAVMFSDLYSQLRPLVQMEKPVVIQGTKSKDSIIVKQFLAMEQL